MDLIQLFPIPKQPELDPGTIDENAKIFPSVNDLRPQEVIESVDQLFQKLRIQYQVCQNPNLHFPHTNFNST